MTVLPPPNAKFDRFLFAPVLELNGLSLTVLSTLTRVDLDPWQEAARLAELSEEEAANSLAATIWKSNSAHITASEADAMATHLVRLLPPAGPATAAAPPDQTADLSMMWFIYAIFLGMMAISGNQAPRPDTDDHSVRTAVHQQSDVPRPLFSNETDLD